MVELLLGTRCTGCDICVRVCPNEVFEARNGEAPSIARQDACHTCFLCEIYCPVDALYVSPLASPNPGLTEEGLTASGNLGSYSRALGWEGGRQTAHAPKAVVMDAAWGGRPAPAPAPTPAPRHVEADS